MAHPKYTVQNATALGVLAGIVLGLVAITSASVAGKSPALPMRMIASVLLGREALASTPMLGVVAAGSVVHVALSAFFGAAYGALVARTSSSWRTSFAREAIIGMLFGLGVWALAYLVVAPLWWPWFSDLPLAFTAMVHAVFYGLPLALLLAYRERHVFPPDELRI